MLQDGMKSLNTTGTNWDEIVRILALNDLAEDAGGHFR